MVGEGIQNYVDMAAGLTKATREKATAAAKNLLATAGLEDVATDATDRVGKLTEEIMAASRANRDLMGKLIAAEVDKAAAKLGFVRAEELDDLRRELSELRMSMAHAAAHTDEPSPPMPETVVSDPLQADPFRGDPVFDGSVVDDPLLPGTAPLSEPVTRRPSNRSPNLSFGPRPRSLWLRGGGPEEGGGEEGYRHGRLRCHTGRKGDREKERSEEDRSEEGAIGEGSGDRTCEEGRREEDSVGEEGRRRMTQPSAYEPPETGDEQIDAALDQVHQLEELPLSDHHDVLSGAHDELQQALHRDHSTESGSPEAD